MLAALGQSDADRQAISDEEIRLMIAEAETAGVIHRAETEMIAGVMRIADRSARGRMTPSRDIPVVDGADTSLDAPEEGLDQRVDDRPRCTPDGPLEARSHHVHLCSAARAPSAAPSPCGEYTGGRAPVRAVPGEDQRNNRQEN